jgi:hypothetical protein
VGRFLDWAALVFHVFDCHLNPLVESDLCWSLKSDKESNTLVWEASFKSQIATSDTGHIFKTFLEMMVSQERNHLIDGPMVTISRHLRAPRTFDRLNCRE